eukprot:1641394-Alexandrium_andersonii.AAC.1
MGGAASLGRGGEAGCSCIRETRSASAPSGGTRSTPAGACGGRLWWAGRCAVKSTSSATAI